MLHKLQASHVNKLAISIAFTALLLAYQLHHRAISHGLIQALLLGALGMSAFAGLFNYWRLLKMTEAPISTIAAAAQGYIELHGSATALSPLRTPYHGIPCVWYRAYVYANRQDNAYSRKPIDTRLLEFEESTQSFELKDHTGTCTVNPQGAEVIYFEQRTFLKNEHRYVEEYLPVGKPLYVLGQLDTRDALVDSREINQEVRQTLADLKASPHKLLNRYDHNRNGQIDIEEWELARQDAIKQAQANFAMKAHTGSFTLVKPSDQHLFLISANSPLALSANYRHWGWGHFAVSVVLAAVFLWA